MKAVRVFDYPTQPGQIRVLNSQGQAAAAYALCCPKCAETFYLSLRSENGNPGWQVVAGDVWSPDTVSLTPSIICPGCGWHGFLTNGELR